jgi:hypothetical protein
VIGVSQVPYKTPIGGVGAVGPFAIFQQRYQAVFADEWLSPWVIFDAGNLTKCYGYASSGTFTADIYIDSVKVFSVSEADSSTPVALLGGQDGLLAEPSLIECKIISASGATGIYIEATE